LGRGAETGIAFFDSDEVVDGLLMFIYFFFGLFDGCGVRSQTVGFKEGDITFVQWRCDFVILIWVLLGEGVDGYKVS
jgi:hypothetical protein